VFVAELPRAASRRRGLSKWSLAKKEAPLPGLKKVFLHVAKILAASLIGARLNVLQLAPLFIQLGLLLAGFTELLLIRLLLLLIQLGLLLARLAALLVLLITLI
jgi:hypothetical protein